MALAIEVEEEWSDWDHLLHHEHAFHRWCERLWQTHTAGRTNYGDPSESRLPAELRGDFLRYLECRVEEALAMPWNPESSNTHSPLAKQWAFDMLDRVPDMDPGQRIERDFGREFERYPHLRELIGKLGVWGVYQAAELNDAERYFCDLHFLMGMSLRKSAHYLGLPVNSVLWMVSRVRNKFGALLSERGVRMAQAVVKRYGALDATS